MTIVSGSDCMIYKPSCSCHDKLEMFGSIKSLIKSKKRLNMLRDGIVKDGIAG